jgi:hypothetical protein
MDNKGATMDHGGLTQAELAEIARHFDGRRHGGLRPPDLTAITNEVIRDAFPDATGVAIRGASVVVVSASCRERCGRPRLGVVDPCRHPLDSTEEAFTEAEINAMILAHVRGADEA